MTTVGWDYSFARPSIAVLKANSVKFVCRYLSWAAAAAKRITLAEYNSLKAAGIRVFLNWEYDARDGVGGATAGKIQATEAVRQAKALNYPLGEPIYFSTGDFDVFGEGKSGECLAYDAAAKLVVQAAGYEMGVYGSREYLAALWDRHIINEGWQSPSTFGREAYSRDPRNAIYQVELDKNVSGNQVDTNIMVKPVGASVPSPSVPPVIIAAPVAKTYSYPYQVILDILKALPAPYVVTDTTRDLNGPIANGVWDYHVGNAAVDIAGTDAQMRDNAAFLIKYSSYLTELIHTTPFTTDNGFYVKNYAKVGESFYGATTNAAHMNHVHVAIADMAKAKALLAILAPKTVQNTLEEEDDDVKAVLIVQDGPNGAVYVGSIGGTYCRYLRNEKELGHVQEWLKIRGGDPTIQKWNKGDFVSVIGIPVNPDTLLPQVVKVP